MASTRKRNHDHHEPETSKRSVLFKDNHEPGKSAIDAAAFSGGLDKKGGIPGLTDVGVPSQTLGEFGHGKSGGATSFNQARMEAKAVNAFMHVEREAPAVAPKTTPKHAHRPPAPKEPEPQVVHRPDPKEVIKGLDPVAVVERAQSSSENLDNNQRLAFALRELKDGKGTAHDAIVRVEASHGKEAAESLKASLALSGVDTREGAQAPDSKSLAALSQAADTEVLRSFKDFREARTLAEALPEDVRLAATQTLAERKEVAAAAEISKEAPAAGTASVVSADSSSLQAQDVAAAQQYLQSRAQDVGLNAKDIDAITTVAVLDAARSAQGPVDIRLEGEGLDGTPKSFSVNSVELTEAVKDATAAATQARARETATEVSAAKEQSAEMTMGE